MRRRTSSRKWLRLRRSSLSLLKAIFSAIAVIVMLLVESLLAEMLFWFVTLGGIASLLIAVGIPQSIASPLAIAISLGLFIVAVYISYAFYPKRATKNKRKGEVRFAHAIAKFFANSRSSQWYEYQDWLHDILLARQQLLAEKCPQWQVKLITYRRLTVFCLVVGMNKVRRIVANMKRSR